MLVFKIKWTFLFPGSALDINFSDINVASLERELEEQEDNVGFASQRLLAGSAPVNIPGSLARSSSFNSSSSLSTSPLSSLSQSLSQSLLGGVVSQAAPPPASLLAKQEHGLLGTPSSSSQNSLGLNGANSSIWDFVSGSFSPSPWQTGYCPRGPFCAFAHVETSGTAAATPPPRQQGAAAGAAMATR
ncbi:hypothetical protein CRUP_000487 [Coryphaenoides rupestris]|nr:hypothetical protein CRUP_000487 [Coryphaenoides rupestris]